MSIINIEVVEQSIAITNSPLIASGGLNENVIQFTFSNHWDNFSKTAVFYQNEENIYYSSLDEYDKCVVPHEATSEKGTMFLGVFGVNTNDVRITSEVLGYEIKKGAITDNLHPTDPTPDIYQQLLLQMGEKYQAMVDLKADADAKFDEYLEQDIDKIIYSADIDAEEDPVPELRDADLFNGQAPSFYAKTSELVTTNGSVTVPIVNTVVVAESDYYIKGNQATFTGGVVRFSLPTTVLSPHVWTHILTLSVPPLKELRFNGCSDSGTSPVLIRIQTDGKVLGYCPVTALAVYFHTTYRTS